MHDGDELPLIYNKIHGKEKSQIRCLFFNWFSNTAMIFAKSCITVNIAFICQNKPLTFGF